MRAVCLACLALWSALSLLGCDPFGSGVPCNEDTVVACVLEVSEGLGDECRQGTEDYPADGCCRFVEEQLSCFQSCGCDEQLTEATHMKLMLLDTPLVAFGGVAEEIIDNYVQAARGLCGKETIPGDLSCGSTGGLV